MSKPAATKPLRVAYDILRMSAGGGNGGIKTHHYEFLRHFSEHHAREIQLLVFCMSELVEELKFLSANPLNQIHVHGTRDDFEFRDSDGRNPPLHFWPQIPQDLLNKLGVDVLYAGFGDSNLHEDGVPQVSLLVDVLHRDLPEMVTPEEYEQRETIFQRAIAQADLIQTNSKFCVESLHKHYGIPKEKLFHIYLPLHGRFNRIEMGPLPDPLRGLEHKYFLYPANYWPHKNHARLLEAFALYQKEKGQDAHHLALTGSPGPAEDELKNQAQSLGIETHVYFLGHLSLEELKTTYELCAAVVFPSLYEGFGLPILEAQHFQKPLLHSNTASLPEIAPPEACLFDRENTQEIAEALQAPHQTQQKYIPHSQYLETYHLCSEAQTLKQRLTQAATTTPATKSL